MATQNRAPTGDSAENGTWVGGAVGTRYTLVDDYPDTVPNDYLEHGTTAGILNLNYDPFTVPAGATNISVQVRYYDQDVSSGTNSFYSRIRVNGTWYPASSHNPGSSLTAREDNWANNPASGAAWTVEEVNSGGTYPLEKLGYRSDDANPKIRTSCIEIQVTYTPPEINGSLVKTLAALTLDADGTVSGGGDVNGSLVKTLAALTLAGAGDVDVAGSLAKTLAALTLAGAGAVTVKGSVSKSLAALSLAASGTVAGIAQGALNKTLAGLGLVAAGDVALTGALAKTLGALGLTAGGAVSDVPGPVPILKEKIAQIAFLDFASPGYVGFAGLAREWRATITFLDLVEQQLWGVLEELAMQVGPGSTVVTAKTPAKYNDGSKYNYAEWQ